MGPSRCAGPSQVEHTPRFCGPIFLTGQNQFVRTNTIRLQTGLPTLDLAPVIFDTGIPLTEPTTVQITVGSPPNSFTIVVPFVSPSDAAGLASVYLSRPFNPSRTYFRGPYQLMDTIAYAASATDVTFTGSWDDQDTEYAEPGVGDTQSLRFNAVTTDGRVAHQENYTKGWTAAI